MEFIYNKSAIKMSFFNNSELVFYKQESDYRILCWTLKLISFGFVLAKIMTIPVLNSFKKKNIKYLQC